MQRSAIVVRQEGYGDEGTGMIKQVEGLWQGGTASLAGAGAQRSVPVELDGAVSVKPIRLGLRGCDSAPSAGPPSPRCGAGPLVPRSESLLQGAGVGGAGRVSEALSVGFLCLRRVDRGAVGGRLLPPIRPPLPRHAAGRQVHDGGPLYRRSGAQWYQKGSGVI
ncbi:hypothetical protein NDU88_006282 [Pleurodeles waltl]|uniref:Uncharacterized protein n=1 Tax=Pleurodeles waltl TaxID=8319 RepID=A0AAV7VP64_PLEWA|nr:hypothetical protein NDU88_006282 [Pleurodeles waltl]